jgi:hypothetical protein
MKGSVRGLVPQLTLSTFVGGNRRTGRKPNSFHKCHFTSVIVTFHNLRVEKRLPPKSPILSMAYPAFVIFGSIYGTFKDF